MKWVPYGYMKRAISFCISQACAGLLLAPGMGKTSIILAVYKLLRAKRYVRRMLVISPLRPMERVWPAEAAKWDEFQSLKISLLHGPDKDMKLRRADSDIDVINPEGLAWLSTQINPHQELPWDMLCVDESTRFKNDRTQRFKCLKPFLEHFKRRYILTGSPAPNGLLDLFGQVYILDLGNALGRYVSHYRMAFFNQTGYGGYTWVPKSDAEARIYRRLGPLVLRMAAEDYLQLPPLLYNRVEVELPSVARKAYREMESLLITQVKGEQVLAANAAAATMKCRQIANGGIYGTGPEGRVAHDLHEAKVDAVEEIIEELQGKPALVAYEFEHDRDRLLRRFGMDTPWIGGGVSAGRFRDIETDWNRGLLPILLAQPQSVAHGLNLQGTGAAIIEAALTWNLEDREQFIQRVHRQGQKETVVVHSIVAKDTVDEVIMRALARKDRTQKGLLNALKEYANDR